MIAQSIGKNDRVVVYALEAHKRELEQRLLYRRICDRFFAMEPRDRPRIPTGFINYPDYHRGFLDSALEKLERDVYPAHWDSVKNIEFVYPGGSFTADNLALDIEDRMNDGVKYFIVDHLHHMEHGDNELKGLKSTMALCERVINEQKTSLVFASHLRKADRFRPEFPDEHELHGSSEISKRATSVILMGPSRKNQFGASDHQIPTLMHYSKYRLEGGVKTAYGLHFFDTHSRSYSVEYIVMKQAFDDRGRQTFEAIADQKQRPVWAKNGKTLEVLNASLNR